MEVHTTLNSLDTNTYKATSESSTIIRTAVKQVWPTGVLVGYRFHLAQAWWRNIQSCELQNGYKKPESEIGKWLRLTFGLSLFSPDEVEDIFVEELMSSQPSDSTIDKFTDYIFENYISQDSKFLSMLWASNSISSERTTNACESFHVSFSSNFYNSHPNIFVFVKAIIETQTSTHIAIKSTE